jgi:hypothetical protein
MELLGRRQRRTSVVFIPENEMDILFGLAHPNPSRLGCPSDELLGVLSRRERPIGDPAYEHLGQCSHCYRELRALQQASRGYKHTFARHRRLLRRLRWRVR